MTTVLIVLAVWLLVSVPVCLLVARFMGCQRRAEGRYVQVRPKGLR